MHDNQSRMSRTLAGEGRTRIEREHRYATTDMPLEIMDAMELVLAYLWDDEQRDFLADPTDDHVFLRMLAVRGWLGLARSRIEDGHRLRDRDGEPQRVVEQLP
jgi:hypothetical protein